jgi:hypothetical protein
MIAGELRKALLKGKKMDEQRHATREDVLLPARLSICGEPCDALVRNLSSDGAMVTVRPQRRAQASVGAECLFEISLRGDEVRSYEARIVRVFELDDGDLGLAVTF